MRKFSLIVLIIIALICTACSTNVNPDNLDFDKSFSFTANLEYHGRNSAAQFTRTAPDEWSGTLNEPYALQGVEIAYTPLEMSISYAGFAVDYNELPPDINVTAFVMFSALENAFRGEDTGITSGKDWVEIAGKSDGSTYIFRLDRYGNPATLDVPGRQLKVIFTDVVAVSF
jgi:hypothetical protein